MLDRELHQKFLKALMAVPAAATKEGRTALLAGLPLNVTASLPRSNTSHTDLGNIINGLDKLGCLTDTGQKPLLIVAQNAWGQLEGTEAGHALAKIIAALETYYDATDLTCKPAMYQLILPHNFDLKELVRLCEKRIPLEPALTRIVFLCHSPRLLTYLCAQLKERLRKFIPKKIEVRRYKISELHTPVSHVINEIDKFRRNLTVFNMLISVQVEKYQDAKILWNELSEKFDEKLDHHLVVIMEIRLDAGLPKSKKLYSPVFELADVRNWISDVINGHGWRKELITDWSKLVNFECNYSDILDIESVYDHICEIETYFRDEMTYEEFHNIIKDRLNDYVQTCD